MRLSAGRSALEQALPAGDRLLEPARGLLVVLARARDQALDAREPADERRRESRVGRTGSSTAARSSSAARSGCPPRASASANAIRVNGRLIRALGRRATHRAAVRRGPTRPAPAPPGRDRGWPWPAGPAEPAAPPRLARPRPALRASSSRPRPLSDERPSRRAHRPRCPSGRAPATAAMPRSRNSSARSCSPRRRRGSGRVDPGAVGEVGTADPIARLAGGDRRAIGLDEPATPHQRQGARVGDVVSAPVTARVGFGAQLRQQALGLLDAPGHSLTTTRMPPAPRFAPRSPRRQPARSARAQCGRCRGRRAESRSGRGWRGQAEAERAREPAARTPPAAANARPNALSD